MSAANKSEKAKTEQQEHPELSDKHLAAVSGGATEELFGAYNFLLEVAETTGSANIRPSAFRTKKDLRC